MAPSRLRNQWTSTDPQGLGCGFCGSRTQCKLTHSISWSDVLPGFMNQNHTQPKLIGPDPPICGVPNKLQLNTICFNKAYGILLPSPMFKKSLLWNGRHPSFGGACAISAVRLLCAFLVASASLLSSMQAIAASGKPVIGQKSTTRLPSCSWDQPGHNPFVGDVVAAIDRYQDIPVDVRARLKQRMTQRDYDDIVSIRRDSLAGKYGYDPVIRDMHFGVDRVCTQVSRQKWAAEQQERGLVYCEGSQCILVPNVCSNVSRITRLEPVATAAAHQFGSELLFDAPGAGETVDAAPTAPGPDTFAALSSQESLSDSGEVVPQTTVGDIDPKPDSFPSSGDKSGHLGSPGSPGNSVSSGSPGSPGSAVVTIAPIPEPATSVLMLLGVAAGLIQIKRRRPRNA